MGKTKIFWILALFTVFWLGGCSNIRYMETETPRGQVPEPPPAAESGSVPDQHAGEASVVQTSPKTGYEMENAAGRLGTSGESGFPGDCSGTMARFQSAYDAEQSPRMAVFLNRRLSDEVRDWVTDARGVLTIDYQASRTTPGKPAERSQGETNIYRYGQQRTDGGARSSPREKWMWAFENGFIQPFLQSGAKIVDRPTIMRLMAASTEKQQGAASSVSIKRVEMDALKGYADILVEILIARSPASAYGYEFKASAKEIDTGVIIANVTSLNWQQKKKRQQEIRATSNGYQFVDKDSEQMPSAGEVAETLSIDLMNALASAWNR